MKSVNWFNGKNKSVLFDRKELFEIFDCLNDKLKENSLIVNITVYGGTMMSLVYDNRPATRDIDYMFNDGDYKLFQIS